MQPIYSRVTLETQGYMVSKVLLVDLTEAQTWLQVVDRARREMAPEIGVVGTWALLSREGVSMDASELVPPGEGRFQCDP